MQGKLGFGWTAAAIVAVALWGFGGVAVAQEVPGTIEISPMVGGYFGGTMFHGGLGELDSDVEFDDSPVFGLRLGYNTSRSFALEFAYTRVDPDLTPDLEDPDEVGGFREEHYDVNGNFHFGSPTIMGFFTLGLGAMHLEGDVEGVAGPSNLLFSANAGVGLKWFLTDHFAIRAEGRYRFTQMDEEEYFCTPESFCYYYESSYHSLELMAGVTFRF